VVASILVYVDDFPAASSIQVFEFFHAISNTSFARLEAWRRHQDLLTAPSTDDAGIFKDLCFILTLVRGFL
jgi:hypothetical protein